MQINWQEHRETAIQEKRRRLLSCINDPSYAEHGRATWVTHPSYLSPWRLVPFFSDARYRISSGAMHCRSFDPIATPYIEHLVYCYHCPFATAISPSVHAPSSPRYSQPSLTVAPCSSLHGEHDVKKTTKNERKLNVKQRKNKKRVRIASAHASRRSTAHSSGLSRAAPGRLVVRGIVKMFHTASSSGIRPGPLSILRYT